jgi:ABC-type transport system involved in multi-copper enzyme maturation permease subunit
MAIFEIGIKILFLLTFIFFLVFFLLCRGWATPRHPERANIIGVLVSILYTFWFFLVGLLLLVLISLAWQYFPTLFKLSFPLKL